MDIYLLNSNFEIVTIVDDFSSLIWRRRYNEPGNFELHCTHEMFGALSGAKYIYRPDRTEIGMVENYGLEYPSCFAKGRFLECLMTNRIIYPVQSFSSKTHEYIARSLMGTFLPGISLGAVNSPEIGSPITTQVTGKNLMEYIYSLLGTVEASCSVACDLATKALIFRVWQGADRRASAIFSREWDNLKSFTYEYSDKDFKDCAVVAGEGEGSARQFVTVGNSENDRREIFVDARDLQHEEEETAENYAARFAQRGREKLAEYATVEKCEAEIDTESDCRQGFCEWRVFL